MKRPLLVLLAILGIASLACGLLDSEAATITVEEGFPFDFVVDADEACAGFEDDEFDCDGDSEEAPEDIELPPIEVGEEIDLIEVTDDERLEDIADRIRTLTITGIEYEVTDNDLTFNLPEVEIFVAPVDVESTDHDDAVHLTTIPETPAGEDVSPAEEAEVEGEDRQQAASDIFKQLDFTILARGRPKVEQGQEFPPSGSAEVELTFNIKVEGNPTDEL